METVRTTWDLGGLTRSFREETRGADPPAETDPAEATVIAETTEDTKPEPATREAGAVKTMRTTWDLGGLTRSLRGESRGTDPPAEIVPAETTKIATEDIKPEPTTREAGAVETERIDHRREGGRRLRLATSGTRELGPDLQEVSARELRPLVTRRRRRGRRPNMAKSKTF